MNDHSELLSRSLGVVYPIMAIIGVYVILNGHMTPGGGFQGGVVIAALFICKYFVLPIKDTRLKKIQKLEKLILFFILLFPLSFVLGRMNVLYTGANVFYMIIMNALIGLKVACGISIIFFRFVYYEVR